MRPSVSFHGRNAARKRKQFPTPALTHRALKICSKSALKHELENIRSILVKNGYPEFLIDSRISKKLLRFQQSTKEGPKKCPVYLKLPWIGENSLKFERKIKLSINNCFGAVQPRVIFSIRRILPAIHKDVLPTFQQSNVSTFAGQNPPACAEVYSEQNQ